MRSLPIRNSDWGVAWQIYFYFASCALARFWPQVESSLFPSTFKMSSIPVDFSSADWENPLQPGERCIACHSKLLRLSEVERPMSVFVLENSTSTRFCLRSRATGYHDISDVFCALLSGVVDLITHRFGRDTQAWSATMRNVVRTIVLVLLEHIYSPRGIAYSFPHKVDLSLYFNGWRLSQEAPLSV